MNVKRAVPFVSVSNIGESVRHCSLSGEAVEEPVSSRRYQILLAATP